MTSPREFETLKTEMQAMRAEIARLQGSNRSITSEITSILRRFATRFDSIESDLAQVKTNTERLVATLPVDPPRPQREGEGDVH